MAVLDTLCLMLSESGVAFRRAGEHHHVRQGWVSIDCPWCGKHTGAFHLGISGSLRASCWRCGRKPIHEVWKELRLPVGAWKPLRGKSPGHVTEETPRGTLKLTNDLGCLQRPHKQYLESRGLDPSLIESMWGVGGVGRRGGHMAWRLFIPVHLNGDVVSWTSRRVGAKGKRWLSSPPTDESVPLKRLIYGMDHVNDVALICEGAPDCWSLGYGAVACLGLGGITHAQVEALSLVPIRVVLFDDEPRAQREAARLASLLSSMPGETYRVELDNGKSGIDPGEASYESLVKIRREFLGDSNLPWIL